MANTYGLGYSGEDFKEWWMHHYKSDYNGETSFVKNDGMTDEDYAYGKQLYRNMKDGEHIDQSYGTQKGALENYYTGAAESTNKSYDAAIKTQGDIYDKNSQNLLDKYNSDVGILDKNRRQSRQNASMSLDKLKKYLPTQIKAQGLAGLGVSESSALQAYANYDNQMGRIDSDYQDAKGELDRNYGDSKTSLDTTHMKAVSDLDIQRNATLDNYLLERGNKESELELWYGDAKHGVGKDADGNYLTDRVTDKYDELEADEKAQLKSEQSDSYKTASGIAKTMSFESEADVEAFCRQYADRLSASQLADLRLECMSYLKQDQESAHGANYQIAAQLLSNMDDAKFGNVGDVLAAAQELGARYGLTPEEVELLYSDREKAWREQKTASEESGSDDFSYGYVIDKINSGMYNTVAELERLYEAEKSNMTERERRVIETELERLRNSPDRYANEAAYYQQAFFKGEEAISLGDALAFLYSLPEGEERERYREQFEIIYPGKDLLEKLWNSIPGADKVEKAANYQKDPERYMKGLDDNTLIRLGVIEAPINTAAAGGQKPKFKGVNGLKNGNGAPAASGIAVNDSTASLLSRYYTR